MNPWRQRLKWAVYAMLFADFLVYLYQDVTYAQYTLDAGSNLREVLAAYVTSIDLVAWFALILLFELETGVRAGRDWTGAARWVVRALRLFCYVAILHTSFASVIALREFQDPQQLPAANDVCAYAGEWTFLRNRDYLEIDAGNCTTIGRGPQFFALSDDNVLTDRAGLAEGTILAWTDLVEAVAWLLVVLAIEAIVRLKHTASGNGTLVTSIERLEVALYVADLCDCRLLGLEGPAALFLGRAGLAPRLQHDRLEHPRLAPARPAALQRFADTRLRALGCAGDSSSCSVISDSMSPSSALEQMPSSRPSSCPFGAT